MMLMLLANNWICISLHRKDMKKGQITFFYFKFISFFFSSTTSYLLRSHPACWIASRDNSAAIPLTLLSTLLNVAITQHGYVAGTVFVGKRLVLAYYFPTTPPRRFHIVFPKAFQQWLYGVLSEMKGMEKARPEGNLGSVLHDWGDSQMCGLHKLWEPLPWRLAMGKMGQDLRIGQPPGVPKEAGPWALGSGLGNDPGLLGEPHPWETVQF